MRFSSRVFAFHCSFVHTKTYVSAYPTRRTMVADSPSVFRPFLQEFFVKASDPLFTCTLKLDVLTALVTKDNCATILGELQTYVLHRDKSFVCAAVRAVGRVAHARPEAADQCLHVRVFAGYLHRLSMSIGLVLQQLSRIAVVLVNICC